jgi:membrane fusion protein, multidrug efflux system
MLFIVSRYLNMAQESKTQLGSEGSFWSRWRFRILILFVLATVAGGGIWYAILKRSSAEPVETEPSVPEVMVRSYGDLVESAALEKIGTIEPAEAAPLIARTGGRVTDITARLGSEVSAGQVVVAIDGGNEPSIVRVQLSSASAALRAFDDIESAALASADLAVTSAQLAREAAAASKPLTGEQVAKSREQADLAVRQAELAWQDLREGDDATDVLLRSADVALKMAQLAQDQATIVRNIANRQTGDALKQADVGLASVQQARRKAAADLAGQRVSIAGQAAAAREQLRLSQVTAPLAGQVTSLSVQVGDFVRPGQQVGEIIAFAGARVTINVITGVREKLQVGQQLTLRSGGQEFAGEVVRLADGPRTQAALWQVDIFIGATPAVIHPGELVTVVLPVGPRHDDDETGQDSIFIPLDAVTVRQAGIVLFTVEADSTVAEHAVNAASFIGDFIEGTADVDTAAQVVVSGNRTLRSGETVRIRE